jgi:membrane-associated phospholipid phosphatase
MFKTSIDASIAHSWNTWGLAHEGATAFASDKLVYIVLLLGALWVALNTLRTVQPFSLFTYMKQGLIDGAFILLLPVGVATIASEIVSKFFDRARPFVSVDGVKLVTPHAADGGMPSHHTTFMIAVAVAIFLRSKLVGSALIALTLISGAARVAAGIHFPTDIAVGVVLGAGAVILVNRILLRILAR